MHYVLDGKVPIEEPNTLEWADKFEEDLIVEKTMIGQVRVSTVFLGIDHQFGDGPPLLFETMIFGGELDGEQQRYSTWDEAKAGHDRAVNNIRKHILHSWLLFIKEKLCIR